MTVLGCYKLNIKNGNINAILNMRSMVGSIILTISLRLMQAKETLHK